MESNFTYICENVISYAYDFNIIVNGALVRELEGSGSRIRRHGVCIPLLWPMYHILHHSSMTPYESMQVCGVKRLKSLGGAPAANTTRRVDGPAVVRRCP